MEENRRIKWHPGFYGALEFELREYREQLIFESEHELSKEPLKMDFLVIKNDNGLKIKQSFGRLFRKYNIIEYKSPDDQLSIDQFYKTIGYACLYKALGEFVDNIPISEMSISVFRNRKPRELFKCLKEIGAKIVNEFPGVYYVEGIINIPMQIIVTRELDKGSYYSLKILTPNAEESDVSEFIKQTYGVNSQGDLNNINAVLQVSVFANYDLYQKIRRKNAMCEALRELMKDEIDEEVEKRVEKAVEEAVEIAVEKAVEKEKNDILYSLVHDGLLDVKEAAKRAGKTVKAFNIGMKKIYG